MISNDLVQFSQQIKLAISNENETSAIVVSAYDSKYTTVKHGVLLFNYNGILTGDKYWHNPWMFSPIYNNKFHISFYYIIEKHKLAYDENKLARFYELLDDNDSKKKELCELCRQLERCNNWENSISIQVEYCDFSGKREFSQKLLISDITPERIQKKIVEFTKERVDNYRSPLWLQILMERKDLLEDDSRLQTIVQFIKNTVSIYKFFYEG
jgi:hypothetical protein